MTELNRLLNQQDKGTQAAENIPTKILRGLLMDMDIGPGQMNQLLNAWLNRIDNGRTLDGNERSNRRGNLIKEMARDRLTWNIFEKAIGTLDFDEWSVTFTGKKNGRTFTQTRGYVLREPQQYTAFVNGMREDEFMEKTSAEKEGLLTGYKPDVK